MPETFTLLLVFVAALGLMSVGSVGYLFWAYGWQELVRRSSLWSLSKVQPCAHCTHAWLDHACPATTPRGDIRQCGQCGAILPKGTLRTHDGRWLCQTCKGSGAAA